MASDLISRKALLKVLKDHEQEWNNEYYVGLGLRIAMSEVEEQPTVDAVEVVHGEWVDTNPGYSGGFGKNPHVCSNCHDYYTTEYYDLYYCPRCGAKMDGGDKE